MKLKGSIVQIKSRVNASGDTVNTVSLEVVGKGPEFPTLDHLDISLEEEKKNAFEE